MQSSCATTRDQANARLRQTSDEDNPSGAPEEESSLRGLPQEEGEEVSQCPSCGGHHLDEMNDGSYICDECGWSSDEEEDDGEE